MLPNPDFCSSHPIDPTCRVFSPDTEGETGNPVAQATKNIVNLVNTSASATDAEKPEGKDTKQGIPAAENSGAKNEKPATKMYCN